MTEPRQNSESVPRPCTTVRRRALDCTVIALTVILSATSLAQTIDERVLASAVALRDETAAGTDAYDLLAELTYEVGARLAGSDGDRRAVAWALRTLEARGFQNVRAETVRVPSWQRGTLQVTLPAVDERPLVATALGGSVGTPDAGIEAPLLRVTSLDELRALSAAEVAGHIVYIDERMARSKTGTGYAQTVPNRVRGASIAAERGALGLIIRSVGTSDARIAHTGTIIYKPGVARIPAAALAHSDADRVTWLLARHDSVLLRMTSTARRLGTVDSANVIGEIPGDGSSDEIIVLAAHLDSWDLGTGALDDGAGVAIVVKVAELLAAQVPRTKRTIRVVLFANEEYGLSGAAQYRADHSDELDRHALALESDFGAGRVWRLSSQVPQVSLPFIDSIARLLAPLGIERGGNAATGGADIRRLREAGVPVLALDQDGTQYFDYHHTRDDTLDKVDRADLDQNIAAMATAIYVIAASDVDLGRLPSSN